jgi:hypothetical protein
MGFYNTKFHVKQHDRLTHVLWEGGPRVHKHNLYVYATLLHFTLWDFMLLCIYIPFGGIRIKKLKPPQKKERIIMSNETMKQTINTITHLDSMKAVKVAFDLSSTTMDSVTKVTQVVTMLDDNLKSLAIKVLELEKKLEAYERPKN